MLFYLAQVVEHLQFEIDFEQEKEQEQNEVEVEIENEKEEEAEKEDKENEDKKEIIDRIIKKQNRIKEQEKLIKLLKNQREKE